MPLPADTRAHGADGLHELTAAECLALLPTVPIGRLVHTARALPAVTPVTFVLGRDGIFLRTSAAGTGLRAAQGGVVVAFEVDEFDRELRTGWSVVVLGHAREVHDPAVLAEVARLGLEPWAGGDREHVVHVSLEVVSGRRVGQLPPWPGHDSAGPRTAGTFDPGPLP